MKNRIFRVTKKDIDLFCKLTVDNNSLHTNKVKNLYQGKFKKILVPGILIISKINQILSQNYNGALIVDIISNFKRPVFVNESYVQKSKITIINKKNNLYELQSVISKNRDILSVITVNFIKP
jgi:acyl dehydratase